MNSRNSRRAFRRSKLRKRKSKIRKELLHQSREFPYIQYAEPLSRAVGRAAVTKCLCSCWRCGNPRKYWKEKSYQERKADLDQTVL